MPTLIGAFLVSLPLIVLVGNDDPASLPQAVWLQIAVPLLFIAHFATARDPQPRPVSPALRAFGPFLAWSTLSTLWATDPFAAGRALFPWLAAAGLMVVIAKTVASEIELRRLLRALFWVSVAVSGIGLAQYLGGFAGLPQAFPPAGTLGNKNVAAGFVAAMIPVGAVAVATATGAAFLPAVSIGLSLAFLFHTGCRAAGVALLAQLAALPLIAMWGLRPQWTPAKRLSLYAAAVVFVLTASLTPPGSRRVPIGELMAATARPVLRLLTGGGPASADPQAAASPSRVDAAERSVAIRLGVWRNSLEMVRAVPFAGVGIGNFSAQYPRFASSGAADGTRIDQRVESAHNDYLQLVVELGLVGAGLLGFALLITTKTVVLASREGPGPYRDIYVASGLGILGLLVVAAVSPTFNQPVALVVAATFVGAVMRPVRPSGRSVGIPAGDERLGLPLPSTLGLIGASTALVVSIFWGGAQVLADRHVLAMAHAEARADWPTVLREGLAARTLNPGRTGPRFSTASAMLRLGRAGNAAQMLEELVAADPYNANALGNLGVAYAIVGDLVRARDCFERVLQLRPEDPFAPEELRRIRRKAKLPVEAGSL